MVSKEKRAKNRLSWTKYDHSAKGIARRKRYKKSTAYKAAMARYNKSLSHSLCQRRYRATAAGKIFQHLHNTSPDTRLRNRLRMQEK